MIRVLSRFGREKSSKFRLERSNRLGSAETEFVSDFMTKRPFQRGGQCLEWIVSRPWVTHTSQREFAGTYRFSAYQDDFSNELLSVRDENGVLMAVGMMKIRQHHLSFPYLYYRPDFLDYFMDVLRLLLAEEDIRSLELSDLSLKKRFEASRLYYLASREVPQKVLISKKVNLIDPEQQSEMMRGDGDVAFF